MSAVATAEKKPQPPIRPDELTLLTKAKAFVEENALRLPNYATAAEVAGMSPFHFLRRFKHAFGVTPKQITYAAQIAAAKRLLLEGVEPPSIATRVGFAHQSHFTTRFRQAVGQTPMRWLRAERAAAAGIGAVLANGGGSAPATAGDR